MISFSLFAQESKKEKVEQQESTEVSEFKPVAGETSLEVQFAPFGDNPIDINGIRARFFSSQRSAFRLNAFLGYDTDSEITQQENNDLNLLELKDRTTTFVVNIRPGFERHFKGTNRLSPYMGLEADLTYQTSTFKTENQSGDDINYLKEVNSNGFIRLGANAIAGFDFYVSKKLYLGTELGLGAAWTKLLPVKIKSDRSGFEEPDPVKRGSAIDIGPNVNAQIRLGYVF
ncbi:MAG TPA: hypothetical protein DDY13_11710 [Cytophagales bacterium]|jgi:hypothetical protein|nr:hypothetical protein [Cytophagales bacterium]